MPACPCPRMRLTACPLQLLRMQSLIDCPGGTVADPSHYPASRCVLPEIAARVEAIGNEEQ